MRYRVVVALLTVLVVGGLWFTTAVSVGFLMAEPGQPRGWPLLPLALAAGEMLWLWGATPGTEERNR